MPSNQPEKPESLLRLSRDALRRYKENKSGNRNSLEESIEFAKEAAQQIKDSTPKDTESRIWTLLGLVLQKRYVDDKSGMINDIDDSIRYRKLGLEKMPAETKPIVRARAKMGLGMAYGWRCQADRKGHGDYDSFFRQAQTQFHEALEDLNSIEESTEPTMKLRVEIIDNQGVSHRDYYHATLNQKHLEGADTRGLHASIACFEDALHLASQIQNYSLVRCQKVLAAGYGDLVQSLANTDFDGPNPSRTHFWSKGIALIQSAVDGTPDDDRGRAENLYSLASFYQDEYLYWRSLINKTTYTFDKSGSSGVDMKAQAKILNMETLRKAMELHEQALNHTKSPIYSRMEAGQHALIASAELGVWPKAVTLAEQMLDLVEQLALPNHSNEDHQRILREFPRLGATAASVFIKAEKPAVEALQILERGTGLIDYLAMQSKTRRDISEHPDVGRKPSEAQLLCLAREGPVVCFNVTWLGFYCSHALIITRNEVRALELGQEFTDLKLEECVKAFTSAHDARRSSRAKPLSYTENGITKAAKSTNESSEIQSHMIWLWDEAVRPILQELKFLWKQKPPSELPAIWWVGGGLTALLPIHAAGHHDACSTENAISHVISSYAPSLKRLQASRNRAWIPITSSKSTEKVKVGIVAMPTTPGPGLGALNTKAEIETIQLRLSGIASVECLSKPSKEQALQMIKSTPIVHIACHAELDPESSFNSSLILGSGSKQERVSVADIRSINLPSAQIAYLSACSTAASLDADLIHESIHLAGAFQLEFRHVIGTLWDTFDEAAVRVAATFYRELLGDSTTRNVSHALHKAVREYRKHIDDPGNILLWGPFMHVGP